MSQSVLVADVGGTTTRFARFGDGVLSDEERWPTADEPSLEGAFERYLMLHPGAVDRACVAVAGPVVGGRARLTNVSWRGSIEDFPAPGLLVNDLQAAAAGVALLSPDDWRGVRTPPADPDAAMAVVGLGTGLGEAVSLCGVVLAGEGGHKSFGPIDPEQRALSEWLSAVLSRGATWEDVLSGRGLGACLAFIRQDGDVDDLESLASEATRTPDAPDCAAALGLYTRCAAVEARNIGLQVLARGGVWLCGGMPQRLPYAVWSRAFESVFAMPHPMQEQAARLPVRLVTHPSVNLLGAGAIATR